ncbi:hypothetical protein NDU88_000455 [Pleurodeles waltl]|uniref:Uncharacterized protein n=1 Tax=Pleurodeles waltl TaxID=8319 RepID=A0AAV7UT51_PLEWA|nr:hypothetical protein NDU88_000455 [Pleurodeles waltl]
MSLDSRAVTGSPRPPPLDLRVGTWAMPSSVVAASRGETSGTKAVGRGLDAAAVRWGRHQLSLHEEQVPAPICQATHQHTLGQAGQRLHAQAKPPRCQCNTLCIMRCASPRRAFVPNNAHAHTVAHCHAERPSGVLSTSESM